MKSFILALGLFSSASLAAPAKFLSINEVLPSHARMTGGVGVGNGGGMVVCRNPDQSIQHVELLDYFEAHSLRGIDIDISNFPGDWKAKAQAVIHRLGALSQLREKIYTLWLNSFETDRMILQGVVFNNVPDAMNIGVPKGCEFEQAAVQIIPQFQGDRRYYLNDELWNAMDDSQKAGLVLHELVYREALSYGHDTSVAARYFTGLISSASISGMTLPDFLTVLDQVHFEQTDVPMISPLLATMKMTFSPLAWWRIGAVDKGIKVPDVELIGRIAINIGRCVDEGCATWEARNIKNDFSICNGATSITVPGISEPVTIANRDPAEVYDAIDVVRSKDCKNWLSIQEDGGFTEGTGLLLSLQRDDDYPGLAFQYTKDSIIYASNLDFNPDSSLKQLRLRQAIIRQGILWHNRLIHSPNFYLDVNSIVGDSHSHCTTEVMFGSSGDVLSVEALKSVNQPDCHLAYGSKMVNTNFWTNGFLNYGESLLLSSGKDYFTGSELSGLYDAPEDHSEWYCNADAFSDCMELQNPTQIQSVKVFGGLGIYSSSGMTTQFKNICQIADGLYVFYDHSVTPINIVTRGACQLFSRVDSHNQAIAGDPQAVQFLTGATLNLDANGIVTGVFNSQ